MNIFPFSSQQQQPPPQFFSPRTNRTISHNPLAASAQALKTLFQDSHLQIQSSLQILDKDKQKNQKNALSTRNISYLFPPKRHKSIQISQNSFEKDSFHLAPLLRNSPISPVLRNLNDSLQKPAPNSSILNSLEKIPANLAASLEKPRDIVAPKGLQGARLQISELKAWTDEQILSIFSTNAAKTSQKDTLKSVFSVYSVSFAEVLRQISVENRSQSEFLREIWEHLRDFIEKALQFESEYCLNSEKRLLKLLERTHASYQQKLTAISRENSKLQRLCEEYAEKQKAYVTDLRYLKKKDKKTAKDFKVLKAHLSDLQSDNVVLVKDNVKLTMQKNELDGETAVSLNEKYLSTIRSSLSSIFQENKALDSQKARRLQEIIDEIKSKEFLQQSTKEFVRETPRLLEYLQDNLQFFLGIDAQNPHSHEIEDFLLEEKACDTEDLVEKFEKSTQKIVDCQEFAVECYLLRNEGAATEERSVQCKLRNKALFIKNCGVQCEILQENGRSVMVQTENQENLLVIEKELSGLKDSAEENVKENQEKYEDFRESFIKKTKEFGDDSKENSERKLIETAEKYKEKAIVPLEISPKSRKTIVIATKMMKNSQFSRKSSSIIQNSPGISQKNSKNLKGISSKMQENKQVLTKNNSIKKIMKISMEKQKNIEKNQEEKIEFNTNLGETKSEKLEESEKIFKEIDKNDVKIDKNDDDDDEKIDDNFLKIDENLEKTDENDNNLEEIEKNSEITDKNLEKIDKFVEIFEKKDEIIDKNFEKIDKFVEKLEKNDEKTDKIGENLQKFSKNIEKSEKNDQKSAFTKQAFLENSLTNIKENAIFQEKPLENPIKLLETAKILEEIPKSIEISKELIENPEIFFEDGDNKAEIIANSLEKTAEIQKNEEISSLNSKNGLILLESPKHQRHNLKKVSFFDKKLKKSLDFCTFSLEIPANFSKTLENRAISLQIETVPSFLTETSTISLPAEILEKELENSLISLKNSHFSLNLLEISSNSLYEAAFLSDSQLFSRVLHVLKLCGSTNLLNLCRKLLKALQTNQLSRIKSLISLLQPAKSSEISAKILNFRNETAETSLKNIEFEELSTHSARIPATQQFFEEETALFLEKSSISPTPSRKISPQRLEKTYDFTRKFKESADLLIKSRVGRPQFLINKQNMALSTILRQISSVYQEALRLYKQKKTIFCELPALLYGFFMKRFGLKTVAEAKMLNFIANCEGFRDKTQRKIAVFLRFLGLDEKKPYFPQEFELFLNILLQLDENNRLSAVVFVNVEKIFVKSQVFLAKMRELFENVPREPDFARLCREIPRKLGCELEDCEFFADFDGFLEVLLDFYRDLFADFYKIVYNSLTGREKLLRKREFLAFLTVISEKNAGFLEEMLEKLPNFIGFSDFRGVLSENLGISQENIEEKLGFRASDAEIRRLLAKKPGFEEKLRDSWDFYAKLLRNVEVCAVSKDSLSARRTLLASLKVLEHDFRRISLEELLVCQEFAQISLNYTNLKKNFL